MKPNAMILCGGASRRMGQDKNFLVYQGRTFLQCTVSSIERVCDSVVILKHDSRQNLPPLDATAQLQVLEDQWEGANERPGPAVALANGWKQLCGLVAGETGAVPTQCDSWFLCGNDTPGLLPEVVQYVIDQLPSDSRRPLAVLPVIEGQRQFLCSCVSVAAWQRLGRYVSEGGRSLKGWFQSLECLEISETELLDIDPELVSFKNINDAEQWRLLQQEQQKPD